MILLALAATAPLACSSFSGTTALSFMRQVREAPDPNVRYNAFAKLGSSNAYDNEGQKDDAVHLLTDSLQAGREPVASRALICQTLGRLHRPEARVALLKAIEDPESLIRAEALRSLGQVGKPEDATLLIRSMVVDTDLDCKMAAIAGLGFLKPTEPRILNSLVDGMDHDNPSIRYASLNALRAISGRDLGTETGPWRKYVESLPTPKPPEADAVLAGRDSSKPSVPADKGDTDALPPLPPSLR